MEDFTKGVFPEGGERWIKVKYTNSYKARKALSLVKPDSELGFITMNISIREEYFPQVEALLEIRAEFAQNLEVATSGVEDILYDTIDNKVQQLLDKVYRKKMESPRN